RARSPALSRRPVIPASQNVPDVLQTTDPDRRSFAVAQRGVEAARVNLDRAHMLLSKRLASAVQVLSAQQLYGQASSSHAQAKAALRANAVMLFQALGGGWKGYYPAKDHGWVTEVSNGDHRVPASVPGAHNNPTKSAAQEAVR